MRVFDAARWQNCFRSTLAQACADRNALAFAGVVGLWGIGFFSVDLFRVVDGPH
jgi:hypothetical protein